MNREIKDLGIHISDGNYSSKYPRSEEFVKEGVPFIRANNLVNGEVTDEDMYFITPEKHAILLKGHLQEGDVLITTRGNIGQVGIVPKRHIDSNINAQLVLLRTNPKELYNRYLLWALQSQSVKKQYQTLQTGTALKQLPVGKLEQVSIKVTDIISQHNIADNLDKIYKIINDRKKELNLLDDLIKARFVEMFEGNFPSVKLGDVIKTTSGGTPLKTHKEYYDNGTIPWLTSGEINAGVITKVKNFITEEGLNNSSAKIAPKNTVVIAMYGATAGVTGILRLETTTNQAVCSLLPSDRFIPEFLYYAVSAKKDWMISQCQGGGQPNISQGIIKSMNLIDAPKEEQIKFSDFAKQIDKSKVAVQKALDEAQLLFDSLMQEYFG